MDAKRGLSPAQNAVLNRLLMKYSGKIEGFEAIRHEMELVAADAKPDGRIGSTAEKQS